MIQLGYLVDVFIVCLNGHNMLQQFYNNCRLKYTERCIYKAVTPDSPIHWQWHNENNKIWNKYIIIIYNSDIYLYVHFDLCDHEMTFKIKSPTHMSYCDYMSGLSIKDTRYYLSNQ